MIFNRTEEDVKKAIEIRENKIKTFSTLSDAEKAIIERGALLVSTLNRIEQKQAELKNLLNGIGYYNIVVSTKTWQEGAEFTIADIKRIINNEKSLVSAFFVYNDTPSTPESFLHYNDTNAVEKILEDLDVMINDVKSNYRECGNYNCGGD